MKELRQGMPMPQSGTIDRLPIGAAVRVWQLSTGGESPSLENLDSPRWYLIAFRIGLSGRFGLLALDGDPADAPLWNQTASRKPVLVNGSTRFSAASWPKRVLLG